MAVHRKYLDALMAATRHVFDTMILKPLTCGEPIDGDAPRPRSHVVGMVGFAGSISGLVVFYSTARGAKTIAGSMLGIDPSALNGEMPDAIGEVTNMIAGGFRLQLADAGETMAISIPSVTVGSDFYTKYAADVRRVLCSFRMDDEEIGVELILTGH